MEYTRRNLLKLLGTSGLVTASSLSGAVQAAAQDSSDNSKAPAATHTHVMAIAAHPGDAFFTMGAPVAVATHQGGQGTFLSLSLGNRGSATIPPDKYGVMQREASNTAALKLGAKAVLLDHPDGEVPLNDEIKLAVCDLIRQYKPTVIVTHWKNGMHKDHIACHEIVEDAVFYAALPAIARERAAHSVGKIFYADNWEDATGFQADTYLDTTPVFDQWFEACGAFPMWRGENGFRYHDYYRSRAVGCGCLCGSQYAVALMSPADQLTHHLHSL
jgi:LmbE family N-acetylglucosaminyl deacetylase